MGYEGGDLSKLFTESTVGPPTRRLLRDVVEAVGEEWTERARQHTPTQTGEVASRWETLPVEQDTEGATSGTRNPHYKALFLEFGVDPHTMKPRRSDAMDTPEGPRAEADHPGTTGHHMLARSAQEIEQEADRIAEPHLERWAHRIEENAKRHKGIH